MAVSKTVTQCRLCQGDLTKVLDLGSQCIGSRFPKADEPDPPSVPLVLMRCKVCGLGQLSESVNSSEFYDHFYGYRSGVNATMRDHLRDLARACVNLNPPKPGDVVLDVGCNDCTLLNCFAAVTSPSVELIGIDPLGEPSAGIKVINTLFDSRVYPSTRKAKIVTAIAMFYDLDDPVSFLKNIEAVMDDDGLLCIEVGYVGAMLEGAWDVINHEHLCYYGIMQIIVALTNAGLLCCGAELNPMNGGTLRVYATKAMGHPLPMENKSIRRLALAEAEIDQLWKGFGERTAINAEAISWAIAQQRIRGVVGCLGASTKGNTLLQYFSPPTIDFCSERQPLKWGRVTPGTRIPIISEEEARARNPAAFLVLPWSFRDEIIKRERDYINGGGKLIFPLPKLEVVE